MIPEDLCLFWDLLSIVIFTGKNSGHGFLEVLSFPSEYEFCCLASTNPIHLIEILLHLISEIPTQMLQT